MLNRLFPVVAAVLMFFAAVPAWAQIAADDETLAANLGPQYGEPQTIRFRVGAEITASRGSCRDIIAMVTVPLECPEQQVRILDEEVMGDVEITYRPLPGGEVKQMLIRVPYLQKGSKASAIVTCEVATRPILPSEHPEKLRIPKKIPAAIRMYTSGSPYIESKHQRIRALAKEAIKDATESTTDWEKVEMIYDFVLDRIEYVEGPDKGALETLQDGQADCQGRSALFVALCRANQIPARMVWIDGHVYPEFYMEQGEGAETTVTAPGKRRPKDPPGYWYPCESAGSRAFGEMPLARTILQKGDNFRVPERKDKNRLRYASDFMIGYPARGSSGGEPRVKYIREQIVDAVPISSEL